jgi:hypothetical protein
MMPLSALLKELCHKIFASMFFHESSSAPENNSIRNQEKTLMYTKEHKITYKGELSLSSVPLSDESS